MRFYLSFLMILPALGLAQPVCWTADADSGELRFHGEVDGSDFSGTFGDFQVELCAEDAADPAGASLVVTVETGSANTRNRDRDETLHGGEFFAVGRFPQAVWRAGEWTVIDQGWRVEGLLSLRDVEAPQPVTLTVDLQADRPRLTGQAEISRLRFDVGTGEFADPEFVRDRVDLEFELTLEPAS